jgi:non-specific serine/threonine protein kinase
LACDAVQLFVQRARVVRPELALTEHHVALVAQVCRRLDGMPLAIELAAARLAALSLDQLAARLEDLFRVLGGGSRTALPRQRTLRATLDWSYELLSTPEQALFARLCVFAGGWTLEGAEAVCSGEGIAAEEVLELLAGLVAKSLVAVDEGQADPRYRLLETMRQYGWEKLLGAGEAECVQERHLAWYLALAEQAARCIGGPEQEGWLARLEGELENLQAALTWCSREQSRWETGLRLAETLRWFWVVCGHLSEGRLWLEEFLRGECAAALRARALDALGEVVWQQGHIERALALFEESFVMHTQAGQRASAAHALLAQGMVAKQLGDNRRARVLIEEALPSLRALEERHGVGWALGSLGVIRHREGDAAGAAAFCEESLGLFQELGDKFGCGDQLANLADFALDLGHYERARRLYRESLTMRRDLMHKLSFSYDFVGLAEVSAAERLPLRAARLLGVAHALHEGIGHHMDILRRRAFERTSAAVRATLGEGAFAAAWAAGQAMGLEEAIAYALQESDPA